MTILGARGTGKQSVDAGRANGSLGWLLEVQVEAPRTQGPLQVFGLLREAPVTLSYLTLDEALRLDGFKITEVSEGGSVPEVLVINRTPNRIFLMSGEQLVGAKQNRILNTSLLVEAKSELAAPVSCVEAHRWNAASEKFGTAGTSAHAMLRGKLATQVHCACMMTGEARSDQSAVWREVKRKLQSLGTSSRTEALEQAYADQGARLDRIGDSLGAPDGCSGAVFVVGGRVAGLDLFDNPETLRKLWSKLLRSYGLDLLEMGTKPGRPMGRKQVIEWLRRAGRAPIERFPSVGLGESLRFRHDGQVGSCLEVETCPVHCEIFPSEYPGPDGLADSGSALRRMIARANRHWVRPKGPDTE